jgi:hypothetical protein
MDSHVEDPARISRVENPAMLRRVVDPARIYRVPNWVLYNVNHVSGFKCKRCTQSILLNVLPFLPSFSLSHESEKGTTTANCHSLS